MSKKETFKLLIKEFHKKKFPKIINRDLKIPATKKITTLIGSRQIGKTTYFYQLIIELKKTTSIEQILYVNFEDDRIFPLELKDLNDLIEAYFELYPENKEKQKHFFFDEIQNVPGWESFVRRINDTENVKLFLTGSSSKLLSKEIATSLRGRTLSFQVFPLSFREFLRFKNIELEKNFEYSPLRFTIKKKFTEYLRFGGFPEVVLESPELKQTLLQNYFEMTIYKDLIDRFSIKNTALLRNVSKFLVTNLANIFSINSYYKQISKQMPASKETISDYVSYLEDINFIYLIPFFDYSLKKQQTRAKKAFCVDNGLRNAVAFTFSKDEGRLAENLVFLELKRKNKNIFYWKGKNEIDFVIKNNDESLEAINVSFTNDLNERELKGLIEFKNTFKKTKNLTLLTKDLEKTENGIKFVPLWKWMLL